VVQRASAQAQLGLAPLASGLVGHPREAEVADALLDGRCGLRRGERLGHASSSQSSSIVPSASSTAGR
jgi:hypothetical protein